MNDFQLYLDVQQCIDVQTMLPDHRSMKQWVRTTLIEEADHRGSTLDDVYELTIRVVERDEIQTLNQTYRHKNQATNVLSFPFESPEPLSLPLLGDLVICHDVVVCEAKEQDKTIQAHWAHMVVHGVLHLKGYDHLEEQEAEQMEALEIKILRKLSFASPY